MTLKRFSLFYLAGYLIPTGLALMFAPDLVFKMLFATGTYGDAIPRFSGVLLLSLGLIVVNIIVRRVDTLYPSLIGVRVLIIALLAWLYADTADPFFVAVAAVVGLGVTLTIIGSLRERAGSSHK